MIDATTVNTDGEVETAVGEDDGMKDGGVAKDGEVGALPTFALDIERVSGRIHVRPTACDALTVFSGRAGVSISKTRLGFSFRTAWRGKRWRIEGAVDAWRVGAPRSERQPPSPASLSKLVAEIIPNTILPSIAGWAAANRMEIADACLVVMAAEHSRAGRRIASLEGQKQAIESEIDGLNARRRELLDLMDRVGRDRESA